MYRLRSERARETRRKLRNLAVIALLLTVSLAAGAFFASAVVMTSRDVAAKTARLESANAKLRASSVVTDEAVTDEELSLIRIRSMQVKWSNIIRTASRLAIPELWFTQLKLTEGSLVGGDGRVPGFHIEGRLTAGRKEESLAKLMAFIAILRDDPLFTESFREVKLVTSRWRQSTDDEYLEFEIFCSMAGQ